VVACEYVALPPPVCANGCGILSQSPITDADLHSFDIHLHQALDTYNKFCRPPVVPEVTQACTELDASIKDVEKVLQLLE
jgi:inhibitor of KinA sporulation pathway (predicted exonuclease)